MGCAMQVFITRLAAMDRPIRIKDSSLLEDNEKYQTGELHIIKTTDEQQEQLIVNQEQGKGKEVEREEDGEMSSGFLQKQHGRELHKIEMNDVYMRRATLYDTG